MTTHYIISKVTLDKVLDALASHETEIIDDDDYEEYNNEDVINARIELVAEMEEQPKP